MGIDDNRLSKAVLMSSDITMFSADSSQCTCTFKFKCMCIFFSGRLSCYRKVPKFSDTRKPCLNQPKIQTKRPNLRVFRQKDSNGIANSEDPDQTAPLGAV